MPSRDAATSGTTSASRLPACASAAKPSICARPIVHPDEPQILIQETEADGRGRIKALDLLQLLLRERTPKAQFFRLDIRVDADECDHRPLGGANGPRAQADLDRPALFVTPDNPVP